MNNLILDSAVQYYSYELTRGMQMRFRSISLHMVSLAAVTLVTAGCAAGGAGIRTPVEEGHVHNYQLDEGMEIRFESVGEMSIEMDVPEMPIEQPIDMTFTSITCFEVEEMSEEGIKGVLVIEDMSLEGMTGCSLAPGPHSIR